MKMKDLQVHAAAWINLKNIAEENMQIIEEYTQNSKPWKTEQYVV